MEHICFLVLFVFLFWGGGIKGTPQGSQRLVLRFGMSVNNDAVAGALSFC